LHLQATLTRELLETMTDDLVQRCMKVCAQVLAEAKVQPGQLGDILLVGGQTRMPKIQDAVRQMFNKDPSKNVNPDEAVALGAAIQGSMLLHEEQEMLLLDVTPHSLGIAIAGGFFQKIITKNTTVPTSAHHVFTTVKDDQTVAKITVLQGEGEMATENELLGEFLLTGLRAAPRGKVDIDVVFDISADGIVSVSAVDVQTGARQSITVTASSGLTDEEIEKATKSNEDWMLGQKEDPEFQDRKTRAEELFREFEQLWPRLTTAAANGLGQEPLTRAQAALSVARLQLAQKESEALAGSIERLERMLGALKGALERGLGKG
jgi:molecular chaperone DnaK